MQTAAIIAEYDPFHKGHQYLIDRAKEKYGADHVIVIMSGSFVQRGGPAAFPPSLRARMALSCGADLVLQLPVYGSCASAEVFASSAVSILDSLGIVDMLCFGCEDENLGRLLAAADALSNESEEFKVLLNNYMKTGISFPAARCKALSRVLNDPSVSDLLMKPNNILAVEYLKALIKTRSTVRPCPVARIGNAYHASEISAEGPASATSIRNALRFMSAADSLFSSVLPEPAVRLLREYMASSGMIEADDLSGMLAYALISNADHLTDFCNISDDLSGRLISLLPSYQMMSDFVGSVHTKNLTDARIRRALCSVLLNHRKAVLDRWQDSRYGGYINVLGMRKEFSRLLGLIPENVQKSMILRPRDLGKLGSDGHTLAQADAFADTLYRQMVFIRYHYRIPVPMWKTIVV